MSISQLEVTLDRALPQSPEAERAVLGAIMTNGTNYWRVVGIIDERDFFRDAHRVIFRAISILAEEHGHEIDTLTLKHALVTMGELEQAGGSAYVSSIVDGIPDISNIERYARIVKEQSDLRSILVASNEAMRRVLSDPDDGAQAIASETAAKLQGMAVASREQSRAIYDVVSEVEARMETRRAQGLGRAVKTGMEQLDADRIVRRKALTIVGAPTSNGKTTMMLNWAIGGVRNDTTLRTGIYSLEMSDEDLTEPIESMMTAIPLDRLQARERGYALSEVDQYKLGEAFKEMREWRRENRLFFADRIRSINALRADCMRRKSTTGLDCIYVDYLQLVGKSTTEEEVNRITRALTIDIAQDLDIAVVSGSQVNKEWEKRPSGRLSVLDLKYGAVIGEHAAVVCLFHRPRQVNKVAQDDKGQPVPWCQTHFQVEKNRGRKTRDAPMHANMSIQTFTEGDCESNRCGMSGQTRL